MVILTGDLGFEDAWRSGRGLVGGLRGLGLDALSLQHPQNLDHKPKWPIFCRKKLLHDQFLSGKAKIFVTWPILDKNAKISSHDENLAKKRNSKNHVDAGPKL